MSPAAFYQNLSPPIRAACLALAASACFAGMNGLIRLASADLHGTQIVFFRNLFGLVFMLPW
ncbi:MAG: hypothetical protein EXQ87_10915 [Alphaproteobacteria bacterium]|nr:hypothetical protein [Alphaproteobacteria bacterium]